MAGEADIGAGVGTAIGSIWGPVGGAIGGALGKAAGGLAAAPGGAPLGPLDSVAKTYGTTLDGSNWSINFGQGTQTTRATSSHTSTDDERTSPLTTPSTPMLTGNRGGMQSAGISPLVILAVAGLFAWKLLKH